MPHADKKARIVFTEASTYICIDRRFEPYLDGTEFVGTHPDLIAKYEQLLADREARASGGSGSSNGSGVLLEPASPEGYTVEEANEILAPAASAWIASGAASDSPEALALRDAARSMVESERPIPDELAKRAGFVSPSYYVYRIAGCPASSLLPCNDYDNIVLTDTYEALDGLNLWIPNLPPVLRVGVHVVGEDVLPGTYQTLSGVNGCYWATLDAAGEINDNNFVSAAPQVQLTIRPSDFAVENDCALMIQIAP